MTTHQVRSYGPAVNTDEPASAPPTEASTPGPNPVPEFEIRVAGRLASRWSAWFDGLDIATDDDGTPAIRGPIVDQAALHGLIQKLRDVGIPLISLTQIPSTTPTELPAHPSKEK
jgi:hypothetical protein